MESQWRYVTLRRPQLDDSFHLNDGRRKERIAQPSKQDWRRPGGTGGSGSGRNQGSICWRRLTDLLEFAQDLSVEQTLRQVQDWVYTHRRWTRAIFSFIDQMRWARYARLRIRQAVSCFIQYKQRERKTFWRSFIKSAWYKHTHWKDADNVFVSEPPPVTSCSRRKSGNALFIGFFLHLLECQNICIGV